MVSVVVSFSSVFDSFRQNQPLLRSVLTVFDNPVMDPFMDPFMDILLDPFMDPFMDSFRQKRHQNPIQTQGLREK